MSDEPTVDLMLMARHQKQILTDLSSLRDDMTVLTAIAMRQNGTLSPLLTEVRAMHSQQPARQSRART